MEFQAVPNATSIYRLNDDGTYEETPYAVPSVYIRDAQSSFLWNPKVTKEIRNRYGPYVCLMHDNIKPILVPEAHTFKYILGA